jgi:hypothetical protein
MTHNESKRVKKTDTDQSRYAKDIARQQLKITELEIVIDYQNKKLAKRDSLKGQAKNLYVSTDNAIMRMFDKRGYAKKTRPLKAKLPSADFGSLSREELLTIARIYDAEQAFQYRSSRENMRPHYRVASKLYRTTRNVTKRGAKAGYRLTSRKRAEK